MDGRRGRGSRVLGIVLAALVVAGALTACGGKTKTVTSTVSKGAAAPTTTSADTTPGASTAATTTAASGTGAQPVAQETVRSACSPGATVTIAVLGLRVQGSLATLTLAFTPHDPNKSASDQISLFDMNCSQGSDVNLIDPVGLKRYEVVKDSNQNSLGPGDLQVTAVSGQMATAHYTFAAPPANVTAIDVQVSDNWPQFTNVPIQR
jgi:hypothetical protein